AEIVEIGDENRVAAPLVDPDIEIEPIGAIEPFRFERARAVAHGNRYVFRTLVEGTQGLAQIDTGWPPGQIVEGEWYGYQHALAEMPDRGQENRPPRQACEELYFRHVLVLETKPVKLECRPPGAVVRLDHRSAAAGIAADRAYRDRVVGRDEPGLDERA